MPVCFVLSRPGCRGVPPRMGQLRRNFSRLMTVRCGLCAATVVECRSSGVHAAPSGESCLICYGDLDADGYMEYQCVEGA